MACLRREDVSIVLSTTADPFNRLSTNSLLLFGTSTTRSLSGHEGQVWCLFFSTLLLLLVVIVWVYVHDTLAIEDFPTLLIHPW
mmetsp:Transcript_12736/g.23134  ORF Transcript_12736/g.23134 Transcript_12736/m.23134 type:complete len:84 (+) Transcript_12736:1293-1544(+)